MTTYLKKSERKRQIKDAAIELIEANGYRTTSIQDIVNKANTSKGGFYNCYASKTELLKEIIDDGCQYRHEQMMSYLNSHKHLDKETLFVEMLLDKILSYNKYKKLYSMLLREMGTDRDLFNYYKEGSEIAQNMFVEFCKREGFGGGVKLVKPEYEAFINSLIVGVDMFNFYDSESYKSMMREIITAYFEKIDLFDKDTQSERRT